MKLAPRLDGATIRKEVSFNPTAGEWDGLSEVAPQRLLEGDLDDLGRIGLTFLELTAAQDAAVKVADAKGRLSKMRKALALLQEALAYPQDLPGFDVANRTETLIDLALEQREPELSVGEIVQSLTALGEATGAVMTELDAVARPQGEAKDWLYEALTEFFELKQWSTSHRCDNVEPEAAPAFTRFTGEFLRLLGQREQHFVLASLGRDIGRWKEERTRTHR